MDDRGRLLRPDRLVRSIVALSGSSPLRLRAVMSTSSDAVS